MNVKKWTSSLLLAGVCTMGATVSLAQAGGAPAQRMQQLAQQLELTDAQQKEVNKLIQNYADRIKKLQQSTLTLRNDMAAIDLATLSLDDISKMSNRAGKVAAGSTGAVLRTQYEFYKLLTPEQKTRYEKLREEKRGQLKGL
ncbi:Spy/CpxP family protein refolding chaperone [Spongiibacter nanhainus]|uniref:Spy/CpxP family protein refolding chaperone n=1 Tax=Spongiibacter nanhainus TaxID=2794344 RepID=A0A7T4URA0_9GAMM|nr:Spy/CpxP family protein refolding chaperone [Spongiibacter nanhainus]QQD19312.1 Spy/CpxP family protein refolding chaperone [Spongiibacter nanhainus]